MIVSVGLLSYFSEFPTNLQGNFYFLWRKWGDSLFKNCRTCHRDKKWSGKIRV